MTGNVPELNDPAANYAGRNGNYPQCNRFSQFSADSKVGYQQQMDQNHQLGRVLYIFH